MSEALAARRQRSAMIAMGIAVAALAIGAIAQIALGPAKAPVRLDALLAPDFAEAAPQITEVQIDLAEGSYSLRRGAENWGLVERDLFPVRADRMSALAQGLAELKLTRALTADPEKLDRLGLGDPAEGGGAARLRLRKADGTTAFDQWVAVSPRGIFVRAPDAKAAFAADGTLPPLRDPAQWLDFSFLSFSRAEIAAVSVARPNAGEIVIVQDANTGTFALSSDKDAASASALTATALALSRLRPLDVATADRFLNARPQAIYRMTSLVGLTATAALFDENGQYWAVLRADPAEGATDNGKTRADAFNARAAGWAFQIAQSDFEDMSPRRADLVE